MKKITVCSVIISFLLLLVHSSVNAQTGQWEIVKTANEVKDRSECGLAVSNSKFYLIGGDGGVNSVEVFDPVKLTWSKKAMAPVEMHHFQALSDNNKIYVLEAFYQGIFPDQLPMPNVYSYDPKLNKWEKGAEMPLDRRRAGAGAALYNGKLYLAAGIQHGHNSGTTNMFDVYDPVAKTWTSLPDAPHIRDHCVAAVVKDKLYVAGGRNTSYHEASNFMSFFSKTILEVDCYDFKTGQWSTLNAKLPLGSGGGAMVNFNDKLYYMGGERATDTEPNSSRTNVYYLDPSTSDSWKETNNLKKARNGMCAVVWKNKIYAFGGSGGPPPRDVPQKPLPDKNPNNPPPQRPAGLAPSMSSGVMEVFSLK